MSLIKRGAARNPDQPRTQWSPRQVFALIAVMMVAFLLYPVGAKAAQVVSAIITDPDGNQARVDQGGNLRVRTEHLPGDPHAITATVPVLDGDFQGHASVSIPRGMMFIVEHVSAQVFVPHGQRPSITIAATHALGGDFDLQLLYPVLYVQDTSTETNDRFHASEQARLYAGPPDIDNDPSISFNCQRTGGPDEFNPPGLAQCHFTLIGYMVDLRVRGTL